MTVIFSRYTAGYILRHFKTPPPEAQPQVAAAEVLKAEGDEMCTNTETSPPPEDDSSRMFVLFRIFQILSKYAVLLVLLILIIGGIIWYLVNYV